MGYKIVYILLELWTIKRNNNTETNWTYDHLCCTWNRRLLLLLLLLMLLLLLLLAIVVVVAWQPKGGFKRLRTACAQNPVQFLASVQSSHFFPKNYGRRKKNSFVIFVVFWSKSKEWKKILRDRFYNWPNAVASSSFRTIVVIKDMEWLKHSGRIQASHYRDHRFKSLQVLVLYISFLHLSY